MVNRSLIIRKCRKPKKGDSHDLSANGGLASIWRRNTQGGFRSAKTVTLFVKLSVPPDQQKVPKPFD